MFFGSDVEALLPVSLYLVVLLAAGFVLTVARRGAPRWKKLLWGLAAVWAWTLSIPALGNLWVRSVEGDIVEAVEVPRDDRTVIVVLASGEVSHRGGPLAARLDESGLRRVASAVALWHRTGGTLLMTGGVASGGGEGPGTRAVADVMADQARAWGVPDSAVRVAAGSNRTHEDLAVAAPFLTGRDGPTWLVTSALHMPRALAVAQRQGLGFTPHRCDYRQFTRMKAAAWLPHAGGPAIFAAVMHERFGLLYYRLRGWA